MALTPTAIKQCLLQKVQERGLDKSICPSEVARALGGDEWRAASQGPQGSLMAIVREIGAELVAAGLIVVLQKGQVVNPLTAKGPIRFRVTQRGMEHPVE